MFSKLVGNIWVTYKVQGSIPDFQLEFEKVFHKDSTCSNLVGSMNKNTFNAYDESFSLIEIQNNIQF